MRKYFAAASIFALSCLPPEGEGTPSALSERSGSRIRRQVLVAIDGTVTYPYGYWDSKLRIGCSFRQQPDGVYYCVPNDGVIKLALQEYVRADPKIE